MRDPHVSRLKPQGKCRMNIQRTVFSIAVPTLVAAHTLFMFAGLAQRVPLAQFDFNGEGGATQAGWTGMDSTSLGGWVLGQNGIEINVAAQGATTLRDRLPEYAGQSNLESSPVVDVSRDFVISPSGLIILVRGLDPNTEYKLRFHHYEAAHDDSGNRLALYKDDKSVHANKLFETGLYGQSTSNFWTDFTVTSDGNGRIELYSGAHSEGTANPYFCGFEVHGDRPPTVWPPRVQLTREPLSVPYLESPPKIIPIDVGRQLLVDNFLIEQTTLQRTFHSAEYHASNPVLRPDQPWEQRVPENEKDMHGKPQGAWTFSDGVWYDPADKLFKMFYDGGFVYSTCLATSQDGIHWTKPSLNVVEPDTNIIIRHRRDSTTVWLDQHEKDPQRRFKSFAVEYYPGRDHRVHLRFSPDGITWSEPAVISERVGDRTTVFFNPFRKVWVCSMRTGIDALGRTRAYSEHEDAALLLQKFPNLVDWVGADRLDAPHPAIGTRPDLYTLDAVAYESLLLGAFAIMRGNMPDGTKKVDVCIGFSRDGFHWDRPNRTPLLPNSEQMSDWNWGYMHSAGGVCLVVGDKLYFYACGRAPTPGGAAGLEKGTRTYSTGLATLRRDGFASMDAAADEETLTTRPVLFKGKHLFVNVAAGQGQLRAEILDEAGQVIEPFTKANCEPLSVDKTLAEVRWKGAEDLAAVANKPVRFRFHLRNGSLYAFWVSPERSGASHGYVAAGGPGFSGPTDTVGAAAYMAASASNDEIDVKDTRREPRGGSRLHADSE